MDHSRRVFIAGHRGLVGRALLKRFEEDESLVIIKATRGEVDLSDQVSGRRFFDEHRPTDVALVTACVSSVTVISRGDRFLTRR